MQGLSKVNSFQRSISEGGAGGVRWLYAGSVGIFTSGYRASWEILPSRLCLVEVLAVPWSDSLEGWECHMGLFLQRCFLISVPGKGDRCTSCRIATNHWVLKKMARIEGKDAFHVRIGRTISCLTNEPA